MLIQTGKKNFALLAVVAMAILVAPTLAQASDKAVATVNGEKIYKRTVDDVLKQNNVKPEDAEKAFPMVVNEIINEKLVSGAIAKSGLEKSPEFQQRLAVTKEQLLKTMYLEGYLKERVTDKTVKAEYDKFKKENKGKTEVHARHILVKTEDEAKQVIKDLDKENGKNFAELAKERSSDPSSKNGGDIGWFTREELIPAFADVAFNLKPGTYTHEPVKTPFGWHVIYLDDKRDRQVPDLKTVEPGIRNKLGQDAVQKLVGDLRAKADIQQFDMDGKPLKDAPAKKD